MGSVTEPSAQAREGGGHAREEGVFSKPDNSHWVTPKCYRRSRKSTEEVRPRRLSKLTCFPHWGCRVSWGLLPPFIAWYLQQLPKTSYKISLPSLSTHIIFALLTNESCSVRDSQEIHAMHMREEDTHYEREGGFDFLVTNTPSFLAACAPAFVTKFLAIFPFTV